MRTTILAVALLMAASTIPAHAQKTTPVAETPTDPPRIAGAKLKALQAILDLRLEEMTVMHEQLEAAKSHAAKVEADWRAAWSAWMPATPQAKK